MKKFAIIVTCYVIIAGALSSKANRFLGQPEECGHSVKSLFAVSLKAL